MWEGGWLMLGKGITGERLKCAHCAIRNYFFNLRLFFLLSMELFFLLSVELLPIAYYFFLSCIFRVIQFPFSFLKPDPDDDTEWSV